MLILYNAYHDLVQFTLPESVGGTAWTRLLDTNLPDEDEDPEDRVHLDFGHQYQVTGRSLLLFRLRPLRHHRD